MQKNYIFINISDNFDCVYDAETYNNSLKKVLADMPLLKAIKAPEFNNLPDYITYLEETGSYYSFGGILKTGKPVELKARNATQKELKSKEIKRYITKYKKKCNKHFNIFIMTEVEKKEKKKNKIIEEDNKIIIEEI